jgi:HrpA-like RNA helicase
MSHFKIKKSTENRLYGGASKDKKDGVFPTKGLNPLNKKPFSKEFKSLVKFWKGLPANESKTQGTVLDLVKKHNLILLQGETGSGKTTQIPKLMLHYLKYGKKVIVTQPKKIAAKNTSTWIAKQLDVEIGQEVGYQFRGERRMSKDTMLSFVTSGTLVMKAFHNDLDEYSTIIVDEAHERSIEIDLLLYFLREMLLKKDNKIKVIIMSATIQMKLFRDYFSEVPYGEVSISGRTFPIRSYFLKKALNDYKCAVLKTIRMLLKKTETGDILVFLSTKKDIFSLKERIDDFLKPKDRSIVFPLYSGVNSEIEKYATDQSLYKGLGDYNRKIVLSTNVAETSLTIDGVVYVIDTGKEINNVFNPRIRAQNISNDFVTQDKIKQRMGRAGRTKPGIAYHLYTKSIFDALDEYSHPAIETEDITGTILNLLISFKNVKKVKDVLEKFIQPPSNLLIDVGINRLKEFNALENDTINEIGEALSKFPTDPSIGFMILASQYYGCQREGLMLAAIIDTIKQSSDLFVLDKDRVLPPIWKECVHEGSDHLTLLKIYKKIYDLKREDQETWCKENLIRYRKFLIMRKTERQFRRILDAVVRDTIWDGFVKKVEWLKKEPAKPIGGGDCQNVEKGDDILRSFYHGFKERKAIKIHESLVYKASEDLLVKVKMSDTVLKKIPNYCFFTELVKMRDLRINIISQINFV